MKTKKFFKLIVSDLVMLERTGRYEHALSRLKDIWSDYSELPDTTGLDSDSAAEILLRCGGLIGFYGQIEQIPNSQEISKNLLTEARNHFIDVNNFEKVAESENYISLAYYRTNERKEAEIWVKESLARDIDPITQARAHAYIIYGSILSGRREYEKVVELLSGVEHVFQSFGDPYFSGVMNGNIGLAYKNLGRIPEAIKRLESARRWHDKSGNLISACMVKNNLAQIYRLEGRFAEAHRSVSDAIYAYDQIGDKHRKGAAHDTKAQIYVSEGKYEEAIVYATEAIAILKDGVNMSVIAEAYMTKARALIYVEDIAEATVNLHSAMEIARVQVGDDGVSVLAKEFEQILLEKNRYDENIDEEQEKIFKGEFELILPASLAGYMNCDVVRIRNSHLEKEGLPKGALALVANEEVKRGNIVALKELSDDSIVCGYYDHFAEIVSLSRPGEDDLLYKAEEIEVLGKVIGAGIEDGVSNSKILIKPINS